ncbi:MAG TPA: DUF433 domain-containing protein [Blastocatellia bacterium]|nr:DUF433 domain-containing protein [Blastocatellia bacterium]
MSTLVTTYEHVVLDNLGRPLIGGTTMKVAELVAEHLAFGWSPEELHFQHPYLSLGQIYSSLAYYWDHADEINRYLKDSAELAESMRLDAGPSLLRERLKAKGLR